MSSRALIPDPDARDFLYIGMMRDLKGPDVFLDALGRMIEGGSHVTAHFVGDGPDKDAYLRKITSGRLKDRVKVHDAMPARQAFAKARCVVVPSRAESMPYIVLEAIAAGKPIICTNVGGIPEILDTEAGRACCSRRQWCPCRQPWKLCWAMSTPKRKHLRGRHACASASPLT